MSPAWLTLSALAAIVTIFAANLKHYTWWVLLQFVFFTALTGIGIGERFIVTFVIQCLLTILGVLTMSISECKLLDDAADEWGAAYVPLNFLVHYLPVLVVLAAPPCEPPTNIYKQILHGVALFVAFVANQPALTTYGCEMPIWPVYIAAILTLCIWVQPDAQHFLQRCVYVHTLAPVSQQATATLQGQQTQRTVSRTQLKQLYKEAKTKTTKTHTLTAMARFM